MSAAGNLPPAEELVFPVDGPGSAMSDESEYYPLEYESDCGVEGSDCGDVYSPYQLQEHPPVGMGFTPGWHSGKWRRVADELRFHHSSTDGRAYGSKKPLQGTSWLNRPYYAAVSTGGFFMTQGVQRNIRNDNDLIGFLHLGWDWDYYWALEARLGRSGPEMINKTRPAVARDDSLVMTDLSLIYYPAGDTAVRPYLRAGVGWTDFEYPDDNGNVIEASPFTIPVGLGIKWAVKRWMAGRVELVDQIVIADSAVNAHQNLTLVVGLEYRVGAKPKSYWPWNPSRHLK